MCRARDESVTASVSGTMGCWYSIQAMTVAAPLADSLAKGSSDVRYLLSSHNVGASSQAKLFENGIDTLARFGAFVRSEDDLTQVLKTDIGLDAAASLRNWGQIASYLVAWNSARARIKM